MAFSPSTATRHAPPPPAQGPALTMSHLTSSSSSSSLPDAAQQQSAGHAPVPPAAQLTAHLTAHLSVQPAHASSPAAGHSAKSAHAGRLAAARLKLPLKISTTNSTGGSSSDGTPSYTTTNTTAYTGSITPHTKVFQLPPGLSSSSLSSASSLSSVSSSSFSSAGSTPSPHLDHDMRAGSFADFDFSTDAPSIIHSRRASLLPVPALSPNPSLSSLSSSSGGSPSPASSPASSPVACTSTSFHHYPSSRLPRKSVSTTSLSLKYHSAGQHGAGGGIYASRNRSSDMFGTSSSSTMLASPLSPFAPGRVHSLISPTTTAATGAKSTPMGSSVLPAAGVAVANDDLTPPTSPTHLRHPQPPGAARSSSNALVGTRRAQDIISAGPNGSTASLSNIPTFSSLSTSSSSSSSTSASQTLPMKSLRPATGLAHNDHAAKPKPQPSSTTTTTSSLPQKQKHPSLRSRLSGQLKRNHNSSAGSTFGLPSSKNTPMTSTTFTARGGRLPSPETTPKRSHKKSSSSSSSSSFSSSSSPSSSTGSPRTSPRHSPRHSNDLSKPRHQSTPAKHTRNSSSSSSNHSSKRSSSSGSSTYTSASSSTSKPSHDQASTLNSHQTQHTPLTTTTTATTPAQTQSTTPSNPTAPASSTSSTSSSSASSTSSSQNPDQPDQNVNGSDFDLSSFQESTSGYPFLRALHSFDASSLFTNQSDEDPSSVCLSFQESEIVLLHSIHPSGWGDATILSNAARGWIPTNYFTPYSDPKIVPVLSAVLNFVLAPKSHPLPRPYSKNSSAASTPVTPTHEVRYTFSPAAISAIVAGVRSLLESCGTLTRDTAIVRRSPSIRKFRKILLAELAILVSLAKQYKYTTDDANIERLVTGSYKIIFRAVIFLDIWTIDMSSGSISSSDSAPESTNITPTSTAVSTAASIPATAAASATSTASTGVTSSIGSKSTMVSSPTTDSEPTSVDPLPKPRRNMVSPSIENLRSGLEETSDDLTAAQEQQQKSIETISENVSSPQLENVAQSPNGSTHDLLSTPATAVPIIPRTNLNANRDSVVFHQSPPYALKRIEEVHDALTCYLGNFLNHRLSVDNFADTSSLGESVLDANSTVCTQILVNTRKSMLACRELLAAVESISSRSLPRNKDLEKRKDKLFSQIRQLVTAARDVVASTPATSSGSSTGDSSPASVRSDDTQTTPSDADGDSPRRKVRDAQLALAVESQRLVDIATACARTSGECVHLCRDILARIGDFQLAPTRDYPDFSDGIIAAGQENPFYDNSSGATTTNHSLTHSPESSPGTQHTATDEQLPTHRSNPSTSSTITDVATAKATYLPSASSVATTSSSTPASVASSYSSYTSDMAPTMTVTASAQDPKTWSLLPDIPSVSPFNPDHPEPEPLPKAANNSRLSSTTIEIPSGGIHTYPYTQNPTPTTPTFPMSAISPSAFVSPSFSANTTAPLPLDDSAASPSASGGAAAAATPATPFTPVAPVSARRGRSVSTSMASSNVYSSIGFDSVSSTIPEEDDATAVVSTQEAAAQQAVLALSAAAEHNARIQRALDNLAVEDRVLREAGTGRVRGASVDGLVKVLTDDGSADETDAGFVSAFFLTFRQFTTPLDLYDALERRFMAPDDEGPARAYIRQVRVFETFRRWLESHWRPATDKPVLEKIVNFSKTLLAEAAAHNSGRAKNELNTKLLLDLATKIPHMRGNEAFVPRAIVVPGLEEAGRQTSAYASVPPAAVHMSRHQLAALAKAVEAKESVASAGSVRDATSDDAAPTTRIVSGSNWTHTLRMVRSSSVSSGSDGSGSSTASSVEVGGATAHAIVMFLDIDANEIAKQITLLDNELVCRIQPEELMSQNFSLKRRALGLAPNVNAVTLFTNQLSSFVGDSILNTELSAKTRQRVIKHWIKTAERCHELGNFNTLMTIASALQSVNVARLRKTWAGINPKHIAAFGALKGLLSMEKNYTVYRAELRRAGVPSVPYLGLYLTDLTFVTEGNHPLRALTIDVDNNNEVVPATGSTKAPKTMPPVHAKSQSADATGATAPATPAAPPKFTVINFDRYDRIARIIGDLQTHQVRYRLAPCPELQAWLRMEMGKSYAVVAKDHNGLWKRSIAIEPKQ